jgi:hypothetical protein
MPHGFRRADYWLHPWQIRAIQRLAEDLGSTPSAVVRDLLTQALPEAYRPKAPAETAGGWPGTSLTGSATPDSD